VGVGSWLVHTDESLAFFTGNDFFSGAALIIICGIVIFFITVLGIGGALLQIRVLLVLVSLRIMGRGLLVWNLAGMVVYMVSEDRGREIIKY